MKTVASILTISFFLLFQMALPAQEYTISLQGKSLNLPDNPYQVVEVIDARTDKSCIGYAGGFGNEKEKNVPVQVVPELSESILALFNANFQESSEKKPLALKINRLWVYGLKNENRLVLEINLDFYTTDNGNYYHEFMAGHYDFVTGLDIKTRINKMIVNEIERGCIEFLHRMRNGLGYHKVVDEQKLMENSIRSDIFTNASKHSRKGGIYYTFNGFRDNMADTITEFYQKGAVDSTINFLKFKFESREIDEKEIWGVYYEDQLYIKITDVFIPVEKTNSDYIIHNMAFLSKDNNYMPGAVIGFLAFGLAGALVGAAIDASTRERMVLDIDYKFDMATGMPVPLTESNFTKTEGELIFYTDKTHDQNFELFINGKRECGFKPDSYYSIVVPSQANPMNVCLKSSFDEYCETISAEMFNTMYLEAIINKKGKVTLFEKKSQSSKTYINDLIKYGKLEKIDVVKE